MARITDPRVLLAIEIHKGAIKLMAHGHYSSEVAIESSKEMMQELFPQDDLSRFRVPHWTSSNV